MAVHRGLFAKPVARFVATARPIFARETALSLRIERRARRGLANTSGLLFLQPITEPTDAFNHIGGLAKFLAQASDVRVHCARVNDTFVTPHVVQQAVTRLHTPPSLYQRAQKLKFEAGEVDSLAANRNFITRR